ncbi:hypothetical protein KPH14_005448 [Odynerus spinipes]|uniref:Neurotransmitter-gated ion-channel ligand-binding domain-containing protein n=1 Tax=Odynerus spinipes TaxID=1348599 RepID=A0AAD9VJE1_9HYME|nr:hypothetical protein KPH14_005448 [Odynerus spinipes]
MYEKIHTIFHLLLLFTLAYGDYEVREEPESLTCNEIEIKSVTLQLRRHLFCEYMSDVRPVQDHQNATLVSFRLFPKFIEVDDASNTVNVHCWTALMWTDGHLTWTPSQFSDIDSLHVMSSELWTPDIIAYNSGSDDTGIPFTNCWVSNKGKVKCVPTPVYTTKCLHDYTWWPYDVQNCTFQFGSWSYSSEDVRLIYQVAMDEYQSNFEWDMVKAYVTKRMESSRFGIDGTSQSVSTHFILKRHANALNAIYVSTVITLMIMTLTTVWLDPKSVERMILANINFICHLIFLEAFHWQIPGSAFSSSMLMKFFEKSLALACFTLILTSILRHLLELNAETPTWIAARTSTIVKSKVGRILLISILDPKASAELETEAEDNTTLVSSKKNEVSWKHVVMLLSWINFLCILLAYTIMLFMYFPNKSSAKSYNFNV